MNWYLVKLTFKSPLHIGDDESGIGVENVQSIIHSDTIFSALVNAASLMNNGSVDFLLQGNFRISSAFPYDDKNNYYLPRPFLPLPASFGRHSKEVKECEFLQEEDFRAWIEGKLNEVNVMDAVFRSSKTSRILTLNVRPRNASDRQTSSTALYHCGEVVFEKGCGLYFILETDENGKEQFREIFNTLTTLGLGGERSSGYGRFSYEMTGPVDLERRWKEIRNSEGEFSCLLSLWYPEEAEQINTGAYKTVLRKGWIFSASSAKQMKRKTLRMFREGSIFGNQPVGKLVDVTPSGFDHKVYRWGKALSVKMKCGEPGQC